MFLKDTQRIIGYCTVIIDSLSGKYWFYYKFLRINNKIYIFWYCILNYDDNCTFDMYVFICPLSIFFSQISNQSSVVIYVTIVLKHSKNYMKFHFKFRYTPALENSWLPLHLSSKHWTAEQISGASRSWWDGS